MQLIEEQGLLALFVSGFISATLLPGGSEVLLVWMLQNSDHSLWGLWSAVTLGNVLGGVITFLMGWTVAIYLPLKRFEKPRHLKARKWLEQYGALALVFSWVPLIGDPLCLIAGWLKTNLILSLMMIFVGKAIRYLLIVGIV